MFQILAVTDPSHIFFVHSGITAVVSDRIIDQKGIVDERIGFVLDRGIEFAHRPLSKTFSERSFRKQWILTNVMSVFFHFIFYFRIISKKRVLTWAQNRQYFIMSGFYLYLPHALLRSFKLVKSPFCLGFFYIEEGVASYIPNHYTDNNRFGQSLFPEFKKYSGSYGLSKAFLQSTNRVTLPNLYEGEQASKGESLMVVDGFLDFKESLISTGKYLKVLSELMIPKALELSNQLIVKYHPTLFNDENVNIKVQLDVVFKEVEKNYVGVTVSFLGPEVNLEHYCFQHLPNVFTVISSAGHYAHEFGCPVYTAYNRLSGDLKQLDILADWYNSLTKPWHQL